MEPVTLKNRRGQTRVVSSPADLHKANFEGFHAAPEEAEAVSAQLQAEGQPFDPSAHTVADVQAYLDSADAIEVQRVLDAEAAGKNRSSIVST